MHLQKDLCNCIMKIDTNQRKIIVHVHEKSHTVTVDASINSQLISAFKGTQPYKSDVTLVIE